VTEASGVAFWPRLAASAPGYAPLARAARRLASSGPLARLAAAAPAALAGLLAAAWLLVWWIAAALLALGEWLLLAAGALAYGVLAGLARLAAAFSSTDRRREDGGREGARRLRGMHRNE
jgi:hypothetical protein